MADARTRSAEWEVLDGTSYTHTARLSVPGGWLYRVICSAGDERYPDGVALVFVPRPTPRMKGEVHG